MKTSIFKQIQLILFISLLAPQVHADVTLEEFERLKVAVHQAFLELRPDSSHVLQINPVPNGLEENYWWNLDMIHASYVQIQNDPPGATTHNIYLFGGFARLSGMTIDGLAVTACHEIGHGLGGAPKKDPSYGMPGNTTEGQSDYYATAVCLPVALKYLEAQTPPSEDPYLRLICDRQTRHPKDFCLRLFTAVENDLVFFNEVGQYPSFTDYSTHVQLELDTAPTYYPDPQCRLDTMVHGLLGLKQPECWFPGGAENGTFRRSL